MNYAELKRLTLDELCTELDRVIKLAQHDPFLRDFKTQLPEPVLLLIGSFEIRARFYTPEQPEVYVGDPPGSCQGLGSTQVCKESSLLNWGEHLVATKNNVSISIPTGEGSMIVHKREP
jgi:hypothetical protein